MNAFKHPGQAFIRDTTAGKPWLWPFRIVWGRLRTDFKIVDSRGAVIERFKRWRYAFLAYEWLCELHRQGAMTEDEAWREAKRDSWQRAAFARKARELRRTLCSEKYHAQVAARREARGRRAKKFWDKLGGKPKDLSTG